MRELFVSCASTLEPLLAEELRALGFSSVIERYRGVAVQEYSAESIYQINYNSRLASRVFLPLSHFRCHDAKSLYRSAREINWTRYIKPGKSFAIDANVQHPAIRNSLFAAQVVKDAICDQLREERGERPTINVQSPDIQLNLFINRQQSILNFDTSGSPLHKRGYRQETVEAPMRETLAAALLKLAEFQGEEIFYDPCCGSGTLLIEAAMIATKTPSGYLRQKWGFMSLPDFCPESWLKVKAASDQKRTALKKEQFFGTDINKAAIHACRLNLRASGFYGNIEVIQQDFREFQPPLLPTFLMTNPPYGKRMEETPALKPLFRSIGDFMKNRMAKPSKGFVFTGNLELAKEIGLAAKRRHVLDNSSIESRLLEFDVY